EAIARHDGDADPAARRRILPMPWIPRAVVDQRLVTDVFKALALEQAPLIPGAVRAPFEKRPFVRRLAKLHSVVADDEPEIDRDVVPRLRAVPPTVDAEQYVAAIPDADPFVGLFTFQAAARAERRVLRVANEADRVRRRPMDEIGRAIRPRHP